MSLFLQKHTAIAGSAVTSIVTITKVIVKLQKDITLTDLPGTPCIWPSSAVKRKVGVPFVTIS